MKFFVVLFTVLAVAHCKPGQHGGGGGGGGGQQIIVLKGDGGGGGPPPVSSQLFSLITVFLFPNFLFCIIATSPTNYFIERRRRRWSTSSKYKK